MGQQTTPSPLEGALEPIFSFAYQRQTRYSIIHEMEKPQRGKPRTVKKVEGLQQTTRWLLESLATPVSHPLSLYVGYELIS